MMTEEMCFQRYTDEQFLERETDIITTLNMEIDSPHILEYLLLYYKLIKFYT